MTSNPPDRAALAERLRAMDAYLAVCPAIPRVMRDPIHADLRAAAAALDAAAPDAHPLTAGTFPQDGPHRAFVAGAKWWEFAKTGATMWPADVDKAEAEAVRRYGDPAAPPPLPPSVAEAREAVDQAVGDTMIAFFKAQTAPDRYAYVPAYKDYITKRDALIAAVRAATVAEAVSVVEGMYEAGKAFEVPDTSTVEDGRGDAVWIVDALAALRALGG